MRRAKSILVIILLLLNILVVFPVFFTDNVEAASIRIGNQAGYSSATGWNSQHMVRTTDGTLHVAYVDSSRDIDYANSTDGGNTWKTVNITDIANYQYRPCIAADNSDNIYIIWQGDHAGQSRDQIRYVIHWYANNTWSQVRNLTDVNFVHNNPDAEVDQFGIIHLVYQKFDSDSLYCDVMYRNFTQGSGWGTETQISTGTYSQENPNIAINSNNDIHVVWQDWDGSAYNIYNRTYTNSSSSWGSIDTLVTEEWSQMFPSIAIDSNNNIHLTWYGRYVDSTAWRQTRYRYYNATSSSWEDIQNWTNISGTQEDIAISVDRSDNAYVSWRGIIDGDYRVRHRNNTGGSWGSIVTILSSGGYLSGFSSVFPKVNGVSINIPYSGYAFIYTDDSNPYVYFSDDFDLNVAPTQSGESPTNQSTGVSLTPALYVICNDADSGDTLTATFRSNSSGPWVDFATNTSISPGTNITQTNSNFSAYSTTYYWSVNLTDGISWTNETYHFTTPDTATLDDPTEDGYVRWDEIEYYRDNTDVCIYFGGYGEEAAWCNDDRGYVEWDISSLAGAALTANPIFKYEGENNFATDEEINPITEEQPSDGGCTDEELYGYIASGTAYVDPFDFQEGENKEVDLGASARSDLQDAIDASQSWFAIGFQSPDDEGAIEDKSSTILPEEYDVTPPTPKPTLYVEYTVVNYAPTQSGEVPSNSLTGIGLTPQLYVLCTDADDDNMNATWWSNSSNSWVQFASNSTATGFANNTNITQSFTNASAYSTTYYWSVNLTDGISWTNETYHFTTRPENYPPTISGENPGNASTGISRYPSCNVTCSDLDGDTLTVYFYENTTGSWVLQQTNSSHTANTSAVWSNYTNASSYSTTYYWSVNLTDGTDWCNETYHFTTEAPSDVFVDDDADPGWYDATHVKTIQEGIDNVTAGGTVYIWDGTYYQEGIQVNKSVSLIGNGTATTVLEWADTIEPGQYPIMLINDVTNVNISNLRFNGSLYDDIILVGVAPRYVNYLSIYDCYFTNSSSDAIYIDSSSYARSNYINVSDNEFDTIGSYAILFNYCENVTCSNNTIHLINAGITLQDCNDSVVSYNNVSNSDTNELIGIPYSINTSVHHNVLEESAWTGIWMDETYNCSVYSNTVIGCNETGCYGIESYDSYDNLIYNNYFNNNQNAYDSGNNTWNTTKTLGTNIIGGPYLGGNYWSDYTGSDTDGDGLGNTDLPYTSSGGIIDGGDYLPLCAENTAPTQTGVVPHNASTGISLTPDLYVLCTDADDDNMNATWWSNSSNSWVQFASNSTATGFANNTNITQSFTNASAYSTTYYWSVNLTDGISWTNETYHFTTRPENYPPTISGENPGNGSTGISLTPTLNVTVNDTEGGILSADWYTNESGSWVLFGTTSPIDTSGGAVNISKSNPNFENYSTIYYWSVNLTDDINWVNETYHFTTRPENYAPSLSGETPSDESVYVSIVTSTLSVTISDLDGETFDWTIETSPNVGSGSGTDETDGVKSCNIYGLEYATMYSWYVNVTDDTAWTNGTFTFMTEFSTNSVILRPDGKTDYPNYFTPVPDVGASHWLNVDEVAPDGNTTYLDGVDSATDVLTIENTPAWNGTIENVTLYFVVRIDEGNTNSDIGIISEAGGAAWVDIEPTTSWETYLHSWSTCPWTGLNWTWAEVNITAMQIKTSYTAPGGYHIYVTQMYTVVTYSPLAGVQISNENPSNGATEVEISLSQLSVDIEEVNGNLFNWTIQTVPNIGSSSASDESNGTKTCSVSGLAYSTQYVWWVNATNGTAWNNKTYSFTTIINETPIFGTPTPADDATGQELSFLWSILIEDPEGDVFDWTIECTNGQSNSGSSATNGTKGVSLSGLSYYTTYQVYVNATDGMGTAAEAYSFKTKSEFKDEYGEEVTIQDLIDAANPGDTILVYKGLFEENIVINKSIILTGEQRSDTIIDGGGTGDVVSVESDDVTITGFTIRNSGSLGPPPAGDLDSGIDIRNVDNINVSDCFFTDNNYGIYMYTVNNMGVSDSNFDDNSNIGIYFRTCDGVDIADNTLYRNDEAIYYTGSDNIVVSGNTIMYNSGAGIFSGTLCNYNTIRNNIITGNSRGIQFENELLSVIQGNIITENTNDGILLYNAFPETMECDYITISGNTIGSNGGSGIWLHGASNCDIYRNNISGNAFIYGGLDLYWGSCNNTIYENSFSGYSYEYSIPNIQKKGLIIRGGFEGTYNRDNLIYHNSFYDNVENARDDATLGFNAWNASYPSGGNYWSDFHTEAQGAYDNFSGKLQTIPGRDGIVDGGSLNPYILPGGGGNDWYPLGAQWLTNPPVTARFTYSPPVPKPKETVTFDASPSIGDIIAWHWNFGDGSTGIGKFKTHAFEERGIYIVSLRVIDDKGYTDTTTQSIFVASGPFIPPVKPPKYPGFTVSEMYELLKATDLSKSNGEVTVFVIDSGIYPRTYEGVDLSAIESQYYPSFGSGMDDNGHGSWVNYAVGYMLDSKLPNSKQISYKAFGSEGESSDEILLQAFDTALQLKPDIVSLSAGAIGTPSDQYSRKVEQLRKAGIIVICAAGNFGPTPSTIMSPACCDWAIGIAASDPRWKTIHDLSDDTICEWSSRGPVPGVYPKPDVTSPGESIIGPWLEGERVISGTSMATPLIAGGSAVIIAQNRGLIDFVKTLYFWDKSIIPNAFEEALRESCYEKGHADDWGAGIVQFDKMSDIFQGKLIVYLVIGIFPWILLLVIAIALIIYYIYKKKKRKEQKSSSTWWT